MTPAARAVEAAARAIHGGAAVVASCSQPGRERLSLLAASNYFVACADLADEIVKQERATDA